MTLHRLLDVGKGSGKPGGFPPGNARVSAPMLRGGAWGNMVPPRERGDQPSDVEQAMKVVAGTARSMGVEVEA